MRTTRTGLVAALAAGLLACSGGGETSGPGGGGSDTGGMSAGGMGGGGMGGGGGEELPPASEDWSRDILTTAIAIDLASLTGEATITLAPGSTTGASFEIGDLTIQAVRTAEGQDLHYEDAGEALHVGVPAGATLVIDYTFTSHDDFDGWLGASGVSFLWPRFCGNLFPCKSDPSDGVTFELSVVGAPTGATAVHPTSFGADAPSYMPAVAVGEFTKLSLGTTAAGTEVSVWYLPGGATDATTGTQNLLGAFDFYEQTLGTYLFGGEVGSVSANWGGGDYGGMEHHPYWHVSSGSMYHEITHAHEAAHGWYGNGVRIGCWEDFVLSEGTTTYLAARGLASQGYDAWPEYECSLKYTCEQANTVALPDDSCNVIDIISHPLWGPAPYYKGAYFYRGVAMVIGEAALDVALGEFYAAHAAGSARMQDMIDHLKSKADTAGAAQIDQLVSDWLRSTACPVDPATLCL